MPRDGSGQLFQLKATRTWRVFATCVQPPDPRRRENSSVSIFAGCSSNEIKLYTRRREENIDSCVIVPSSSQVDSHTTMQCPGPRRHRRCIQSSDCCLRAQGQVERVSSFQIRIQRFSPCHQVHPCVRARILTAIP